MMRLLTVALLLAGCATAPPQTPQKTAAIAQTPDAPTMTTRRTDADMEALTRDGIVVAYGSEPRPTWYKDLNIVDGEIDLQVSDPHLSVAATTPMRADVMCRDIAGAAHDDDGEPIGWTHVHILIVQAGPPSLIDGGSDVGQAAYCDALE